MILKARKLATCSLVHRQIQWTSRNVVQSTVAWLDPNAATQPLTDQQSEYSRVCAHALKCASVTWSALLCVYLVLCLSLQDAQQQPSHTGSHSASPATPAGWVCFPQLQTNPLSWFWVSASTASGLSSDGSELDALLISKQVLESLSDTWTKVMIFLRKLEGQIAEADVSVGILYSSRKYFFQGCYYTF